jgi:hypothetical protein
LNANTSRRFFDSAVDDMPKCVDDNRRRLLRATAMSIAAAHAGVFSGIVAGNDAHTHVAAAQAGRQDASRELVAIGRAEQWLNSPRLTPQSLAGKVVLVDFWTYTCINWLRTLPYLRAWIGKYKQELVLIGVHTPEFPFERDLGNVRRAVQQLRIGYPVVIDNNYSIWRAFKNQYWPALYLLDARGRLRAHQFGEGDYEKVERSLQRTLTEAGLAGVTTESASVAGSGFEAPADWTNLRSPETYLGYERSERFASPDAPLPDRRRTYRAPSQFALNRWALAGDWTIGRHAATLHKPAGRILFRFHSRDVHLVMGPSRPDESIRFRVLIDGQRPAAAHGHDIDDGGNGVVREQRLYQLIRQPQPIVERTIAIEFLDAGIEAFAYTFG